VGSASPVLPDGVHTAKLHSSPFSMVGDKSEGPGMRSAEASTIVSERAKKSSGPARRSGLADPEALTEEGCSPGRHAAAGARMTTQVARAERHVQLPPDGGRMLGAAPIFV
jgi:hypothetical protein